MSREVHVRFWESAEVGFLRATHLPLYRLEKILRERFGVRIPRQRMCDWIAYAVENVFASLECRHFVPR